MVSKVSSFDISEYLTDEDTIAAYLCDIIDEGDSKLLLSAIGDIAKARGMSKIASESGLGRESIYEALNVNAKPRFETIIKVLGALGVSITFKPKKSKTMNRRKRNVLRRTMHTKKANATLKT